MTTVKIKRGKVRKGRTLARVGFFGPIGFLLPSRKADQITVTTSEVDPSTPYEATVAGHNERWEAYQAERSLQKAARRAERRANPGWFGRLMGR